MIHCSHRVDCLSALIMLIVFSATSLPLATDMLGTEGPSDAAAEIRRLSDAGEADRAISEARELLRERESEFGRDSPIVAEALEMLTLGLARKHPGDMDGRSDRLAYAERALKIRLEQPIPDAAGTAQAWYMIGLVHNLAGDPQSAIEPFGTALRILEARFGELAPETEIYLREYGAALFGAGHTAQARLPFEHYHEVAVAKHGAGHPETFGAIYNLALVYLQTGNLERAVAALDRAEAVLTGDESGSRSMLIRVRSERALVQMLRGELGVAVASLESVLEDAYEEFGPQAPITAAIANNLAFALLDFGHAARAREVLTRVLVVDPEHPLPPIWEAKSRMNFARSLQREGRLRDAKAEYERAYRRGLEVLDPKDSLWGEFHTHRGRLLADLGESAAAQNEFDLALAALARRDVDPGLDRADVLAAAGRLDLETGNATRARERLLSALTIVQEIAGEGHRWHRTREDLAQTYWALNSREEAFLTAIEAARDSIAFDRATLGTLVERQALTRVQRSRTARNVALTALLTGEEAAAEWRRDAYELVLHSRALVFDELAERQRRWALSSGDSNYSAWRDAKRRYANLFVVGPKGDTAGYVRRLEDARAELERAEAKLAIREASVAEASSVNIRTLQESLQSTEAILSFVRFQRLDSNDTSDVYSAAVLLPETDAPVWIPLGPAPPIDTAIESWQHSVSRPPGGKEQLGLTLQAGRNLRSRIWDPIASALLGRSRIFIVPDGRLHLVSFSALPGVDSGYLIEEGPAVQYLTAERDLLREDPPASTGEESKGLLIVSNPAYSHRPSTDAQAIGFRGLGSPCDDFRSRRFGPLPGTLAEAEAVRSLWIGRGKSPHTVLTGPDATEARVKEAAAGQRVLHFATHGFFLGEGCSANRAAVPGTRGIGGLTSGRSRLATDPTEPNRPMPSESDEVSPMLLSGLALAGANRRNELRETGSAEDGILTAEELGALDLSGVELAVVSACDTGRGTVAEGEGLFGLRRAFLLAGVRTVVTNLWQVDDRFAKDWIERMYGARFVEGESMADAVRMASLRILHSRRKAGLDDHPFFWAGWMATGD